MIEYLISKYHSPLVLGPRPCERIAKWRALIAALTLTLCGSVLAHDSQEGSPTLPAGHGATEGVLLGRSSEPTAPEGAVPCPADAAVRHYSIAAINVEISLNRYLDYDPQGRMFALEHDLERVRAEEALNRAARSSGHEPGVSIGLQNDAIQPLAIRINQGECLRIELSNRLNDQEPVSLEIHGAALYLPESGRPATASEPEAVALAGESVVYEWWVPESEPEGTHYFHSHADARRQTSHGLFGAIIVEPKGSQYLDPLTGAALESGWSAIIAPPSGTAFREFVLFYHEIGNERYRHLDRRGRLVVQIDPFTGAYRPGDRAINYRSEPFMNRVALQQERQGRFDESLAYSSYAFGDPATPIARSYLGDPVKQRLVHGGSEVFHVHHVHGGATRWQRQPILGDTGFNAGLDKQRPLTTASSRLDSQSLGPSESFDVEHECGSGGCQQGAGDYLIHCHIAHHYFAGMWMLWRVYNTLQDGEVSQDVLPPLQELPDRQGKVQPAVTSAELPGRTVDWRGMELSIEKDSLADWVERQLPPQGVPGEDDASVFDWLRDGDLYLSEPETGDSWPGHVASASGTSSTDASATASRRQPIYFDPNSGKLAYPWLRPHLFKRPPFAPNHGPAPFLDPLTDGNEPPAPGANGPWSVCPEGAVPRQFTIHAISVPIALNERLNVVDPVGQLFVLKEDEETVRNDGKARVPLAIRGNAGEDCIDILFKSELPDARENAFHSKANIHVHMVQFDVQASDGLTAGYNYEQSVRPFTVEGERLVAPAAVGDVVLELDSTDRFQPGALVGIGMDEEDTFEVGTVAAAEGGRLTLNRPLRFTHEADEIVSTEFVRYRWYPDVQFGTAYFHDHVLGLSSWRHGLFGAFIAEPPGSSYRDPHSGEELRSGPIADIHTEARLSADVRGSFRELVLFLQDDNPLTRFPDTTGSSINMRVEPRSGVPSELFSSREHGDPETPILEANVGDPIAIRGLVAATNDVHTLSVAGHWFRLEPDNPESRPVNAVHLGISERSDLVLPRAGGPQAMPGDYLYRNGRITKLREGSWGILRVLGEGSRSLLQPLPGVGESTAATTVCPVGAPVKDYRVVALQVPLQMLDGQPGKAFVPAEDQQAVISGTKAVEPWVIRANVGDCLRVELRNLLPEEPVSLHAAMLAADPLTSGGLEVGHNPAQAVAPGETRTYTFYAHPEVGETVALVSDGASPIEGPRAGLFGAVIVGAEGTSYTEPRSGRAADSSAGWRMDAHPSTGPSYRDFVLFLQDEDPIIGTAVMPYVEQVQGLVGLNYRRSEIASLEPGSHGVFARLAANDPEKPTTPLLEAFEGDDVRIHVLVPSSEQMHVFSVEGHSWPLEPFQQQSNQISSQAVGGLQAITLRLDGGAAAAGTYLYGDHREPYRDAGLWGFFRVHPKGSAPEGLRPFPSEGESR